MLAAVCTPDNPLLAAVTASLIGAGVIFAILVFSVQLGSLLGRSTQARVTRFIALLAVSGASRRPGAYLHTW
jgi:hypothetical protein